MKRRRWLVVTLLAALAAAFLSSRAKAVVFQQAGGLWPEDWPAVLEPLRATSRTVRIATGTQETIYEIPINDSQTFERVWEGVRTLATPGSELRLYKKDSIPLRGGHFASNERTTIRIFAPSGGSTTKNGETLMAQPPWPNSIVGAGGELPEYVALDTDGDGRAIWVAADMPHDSSHPRGFLHRARIDIDLIVDGSTMVDLNHIQLPEKVRVIDRRFSGDK